MKKPTVHEIELAKARCAFDNSIFGLIDDMIEYIEGTGPKEDALKAIELYKKGIEKWDYDEADFWSGFIDNEWIEKYIIGNLKSEHCGDCTNVPATCMRCYAEYYLKYPSTAPNRHGYD